MISILKNKTFLLFFLGNIISLLGFGFNLIAVSWLTLSETGSEFALGKVMASATIPGLFISFFTGYIIDRINRKWILVFLDIFRIFVILIFLIIIHFNNFTLNLLYPVVFFMGIGNSLFWSTSQAFTQEIVDQKDYFNANKLLSASFQIGSIFGAGIGGLIVHFFNPFVALWINILTYFISGILIALAPFKYKSKKDNSKNLIKSFFKGFNYLRNRKDISILSFTTILSDVAVWGAMSVLTISISIEIYDKGTLGYGILDSLYGIGALISVVVIGYLSKSFSRKFILSICYLICTIAIYFSSKTFSIYFASLFFFLLGTSNNSCRIIIRTIFMENINNEIMGRVQTVLGIYSRLMVVSSSLLTGYLIENYSIDFAIYFTCLHFILAFVGVNIVNKTFTRSKSYL